MFEPFATSGQPANIWHFYLGIWCAKHPRLTDDTLAEYHARAARDYAMHISKVDPTFRTHVLRYLFRRRWESLNPKARAGDASVVGGDWDRKYSFYVPITVESNASWHRRRRVAQNQCWRELAATRLPEIYVAQNFGRDSYPAPMRLPKDQRIGMADVLVDLELEKGTTQPSAGSSEASPAPDGARARTPTRMLARVRHRWTRHAPKAWQTDAAKRALCFGVEKPQLRYSRAHVIVYLNACFAHKRRVCAEVDPPLEFLPSRFLSDTGVAAIRAGRAEGSVPEEKDERPVTQERVRKALNNYYADTGAMDFIWRHNRVLWVVM
ncbi:hypothetical protein AURDEDRAFT_176714 [Auricularia subglabra TFB-10046 SS5]|uniref:Uncharacterized protein n=1 Tax=Auricularia subglabra (strain TFB-10046 / SS5) TaxID=717982 RepID=J0WPA5_AURST|nr:hypothetical protein AURDEDRAFT_176714 [Auricularia subglabra TFB-10046 SS5]